MTIGILVDGYSEYSGLPLLLPKLRTIDHILRPLHCDIQPFSQPAQIAYVASKAARVLIAQGATEIVVLIDKENRPECTVELVTSIELEMKRRLPMISSRVVLKVNTFENWLIADPAALSSYKSLFPKIRKIEKAVVPDKADHVDALSLLKDCAKNGHYDKVKCAKSICTSLDPDRASKNSRSFRRFLRVVMHGRYCRQSKRP
jgi:hypothetical protein